MPDDAGLYLVDGKNLTADECRAAFAGERLGDRQNKVMERIEGDFIVDVGCYSGAFVAAAARLFPGKRVLGIDYFEDNVRIAHLLHPDLRDRFRRMSAYALEFADDSVDCVTLQEVIEHLEGAASAIKEINRVLKQGGVLLVSAPNPFYWRQMLMFFALELRNSAARLVGRQPRMAMQIYFANVEWNRHIYAWTPDTLMTLLAVNGFAYCDHCYERAGKMLERALLRVLPFLGPTQILKVRKIARARTDLV
ncbi:MAG TPA: class I SAM-dependent methyltransferase [Stellaceae bacterium]|nr:class I SAM-dependent methyltransferase [Stellaceae bacterium]